ncbi:MAG: hypothetical protein WAK01_14635 [Methylocystis sp.]
MSERYVFPLRYDESEMKRAVDAFVWRALFEENAARTLVPLGLIALSLVMLGVSGEGEIASLLMALTAFVLFVFFSGGWRRLRRGMREKTAAAQGQFCFARLLDEGIVIEAGGPAPLLEWKAITAAWPAGPTLLLIVATNNFIALPIARAPKEALEFLQARLAG